MLCLPSLQSWKGENREHHGNHETWQYNGFSLLNKATYEYAKTVNTRKPNTVEAEV